jgi:hypothetical protein
MNPSNMFHVQVCLPILLQVSFFNIFKPQTSQLFQNAHFYTLVILPSMTQKTLQPTTILTQAHLRASKFKHLTITTRIHQWVMARSFH